MVSRSINDRGSAAAQCGKASPFRLLPHHFFQRLRLTRERRSLNNIPNSTVRQSLTALCDGEAANARGLPKQKCRDVISRHFSLKELARQALRPAEDLAKNASGAIAAPVVTTVAITRILPVALVIALHKALTKSL